MERKNYFKYLDPTNQLRPVFSRKKFKTLKGWDLAWEILERINIATSRRGEIGLSKRLSSGQKTLYFFWYLDAEVENGGFIQYYHNKTDHYHPSIVEGLTLIEDYPMVALVNQADELYNQNKARFDRVKTLRGFSNLYSKLKGFSDLDDKYYDLRDQTIARIEKFIRKNPRDFVKLR